MKNKDFYIYRGNWEDDYKQGQGTIIWQDHVIFEGNWDCGRMENGTLTWKPVDVTYTGSFSSHGKFNGDGKLQT